jgi:hypothetical protein
MLCCVLQVARVGQRLVARCIMKKVNQSINQSINQYDGHMGVCISYIPELAPKDPTWCERADMRDMKISMPFSGYLASNEHQCVPVHAIIYHSIVCILCVIHTTVLWRTWPLHIVYLGMPFDHGIVGIWAARCTTAHSPDPTYFCN